jgi:class I fructose-bisphosphate aldolase
MKKEDETAVDVIAYSAHIACQLGAHVVKVKPPTARVARDDARKFYVKIPIETLADRIRHVVQSAFNGKRIVIFSGGENRDTAGLLEDVKGLADGGAFGSIMGRNAFQRPRAEGLKLLQDVMAIFKKAS